jgi:hypothetical protein
MQRYHSDRAATLPTARNVQVFNADSQYQQDTTYSIPSEIFMPDNLKCRNNFTTFTAVQTRNMAALYTTASG